jgi:hypothetical protein
MSTQLSGSDIRRQLRSKGIPGGAEVICCGGKKRFSRDYESQLRRLKYPSGEYTITENGIVVAFISL